MLQKQGQLGLEQKIIREAERTARGGNISYYVVHIVASKARADLLFHFPPPGYLTQQLYSLQKYRHTLQN